MSNFSFSHSVFQRLVLQTRKNQGLFGKGLVQGILPTLKNFHVTQKLEFVFVKVENIVGKGENAGC